MKISGSPEEIEALFTQAYREYMDAIFRHCYFRTGDRELGKELAQETFMKTWKYLANGNIVEDIKPFLYRSASNLIINELKRRKRRPTVSIETMTEEGIQFEDKTQKVEKVMDAHTVSLLLNHIKEPHKSLLVMRYIDELQPAEIGEVLGMNKNLVSVRLTRALKYLRPFLK